MTMTRYIALALLVAGGFLTAGAALLPAPLFWPSAILAGVAAIVAVVVLVWGETRAAPRVRARARDEEEPVADQWAQGLNRIRPAHESAVSGSSPAASAPDFTQEAHSGVQIRPEALDAPPPRFVPNGQARGAFVPNDGSWPPGRLVSAERFPEPITVGVDGAAEGHDQSVTMTIPTRAERARAVRDEQQRNRDAYWEGRAEELIASGDAGIQQMFGEVLDAGRPTPGDALARALALEQEIRTGKGGPLLLTDVGGVMDAGTAMAVIEQTRRTGGERAGQLVQIVAELSDEVSRLRGRVIGQIGMAAAAQARANEEAIDPDEEDDADRQRVEALSDEVLLDEALRRGLVRREE